MLLNQETYWYGTARVSSGLRWICRCVDVRSKATPDRPYLGFKLDLDPVQLCDVCSNPNPGSKWKTRLKGWFINVPNHRDRLLRSATRLGTPQDIPFLAPMIASAEIYYRLMGKQEAVSPRLLHQAVPCGALLRSDKTDQANFTKAAAS